MNPALKRLRREVSALRRESDDEIVLYPSEDSIKEWTAYIHGPPDTPYQDRVYRLAVKVGDDYPLAPPSIVFSTRVFHPNVNFSTGEICLDILKKEWTPAWSLQAACRAIIALLASPDTESPWNCDAGNMLRSGDQMAFECTARLYAVESGLSEVPADALEHAGRK